MICILLRLLWLWQYTSIFFSIVWDTSIVYMGRHFFFLGTLRDSFLSLFYTIKYLVFLYFFLGGGLGPMGAGCTYFTSNCLSFFFCQGTLVTVCPSGGASGLSLEYISLWHTYSSKFSFFWQRSPWWCQKAVFFAKNKGFTLKILRKIFFFNTVKKVLDMLVSLTNRVNNWKLKKCDILSQLTAL